MNYLKYVSFYTEDKLKDISVAKFISKQSPLVIIYYLRQLYLLSLTPLASGT